MKAATKCLTVDLISKQIIVTSPGAREGEGSVFTHRYRTRGMNLLAQLAKGGSVVDDGNIESEIRWIEKIALPAINHAEKTRFSIQPRWIKGRRLPEIVLVGG